MCPIDQKRCLCEKLFGNGCRCIEKVMGAFKMPLAIRLRIVYCTSIQNLCSQNTGGEREVISSIGAEHFN